MAGFMVGVTTIYKAKAFARSCSEFHNKIQNDDVDILMRVNPRGIGSFRWYAFAAVWMRNRRTYSGKLTFAPIRSHCHHNDAMRWHFMRSLWRGDSPCVIE